MSNMQVNSNLLNIEGTPQIPDIGYYSTNVHDDSSTFNPLTNSYSTLKTNIKASCPNVDKNGGLYTNASANGVKEYLPDGANTNPLDIPYYLAKAGKLNKDDLTAQIKSVGNDKTSNQIQYLVCQLINARNRMYDPSTFDLVGVYSTIENTFNTFGPNLKIPLVIIFIITMYFLISGFFGSLDIATNIFSIIQKDSDSNYLYWLGILIGILIPIITLAQTYKARISSNLSDLDKKDITNNAYGISRPVEDDKKNIDYLTLTLFILLIYSFVAVLFTVKKGAFNNLIYVSIIGSILIIIAFLLYMMYSYIPFFNTADEGKMMATEPRELRLFIDPKKDSDDNDDFSNISSNQHEDSNLRKVFLLTVFAVFVLALMYFYLKSEYSIVKGFLGSCAILLLPMLWVINFTLGIQFFYVYPVFLLLVRFLRFMIMSFLYMSTKDSAKSLFSNDLVEQLDNFKNYSPSWGLLGVDEIKLLLNMMGYENKFSKFILSDEGSNISNNKFISSGFLKFFLEKNTNGMFISVLTILITVIVSVIILFGVVKI